MKTSISLWLIICLGLCLATSFAEKDLVRVKRLTCFETVKKVMGEKACNFHCKFIGKGEGSCSSGTCYCSGSGLQ